MTYARRTDTTQQPIANGLRACGYFVEIIRKPVDLLVRHPRWPCGPNNWVLIECKPLTGKRAPKARIRATEQESQAAFCATHAVPYIATIEDALKYLRDAEDNLNRWRIA